MSENINELYNKIDFLVNGGALKSLTDFLASKSINALIAEPSDSESDSHSSTLNILDASGVVPQSLTIEDNITKLFSRGITRESFELDYSDGTKDYPGIVRIRGSHWEIYILMTAKPSSPDGLINELKPYAG